jgi:hypothetical protein
MINRTAHASRGSMTLMVAHTRFSAQNSEHNLLLEDFDRLQEGEITSYTNISEKNHNSRQLD